MKVKYTRPATTGGFFGTESRVVALPDIDNENNPTAVPAGAVQVDETEPAHDWQNDSAKK